MTCTPAALIEAAVEAGYDSMSPQQSSAIQVLLLCTLANTGGGGGGTVEISTYAGAGPPVTPPADVLSAAIAYSADGSGSTYYWNISAQAWM